MDVFSVKPKKQPKVVRRKLGKEQAWGRYIDNLIEIDERATGKKELILHLHEYLHHIFKDMEEDEVITKSEHIADFLWKNNYRKVDNKE